MPVRQVKEAEDGTVRQTEGLTESRVDYSIYTEYCVHEYCAHDVTILIFVLFLSSCCKKRKNNSIYA